MSLDSFHPLVARWFTTTLGDPTPTQSRGWRAIRGRRHTLIAAPTGSGKTLAAFLTALDELFVEGLSAPLPDEVRVVYVSPLKALSADIIAAGHRREMDLGLEIPGAPLEAVMSHEVWQDYYDRLAALVRAHRTTLVFVNTRRMAERITRDLTERLGDGAVTAHHGSPS